MTTVTPQPLARRVWLFSAVAVLCLVAFFAIEAWVFDAAGGIAPAAAQFDRSISLELARFRENGPTGRMTELSAVGSPLVAGIFALVLAWVLLKSRDWLGLAHLTVVLIGASLVSRLLQFVWERDRPETLLPYLTVTQHSFPSAHMFGAAACYFTFAFFFARSLGGRANELAVHVLSALLVAAIGFTRVYLGAHHTTDVLAGMAGGWAFGLLAAALFSLGYRDPAARLRR